MPYGASLVMSPGKVPYLSTCSISFSLNSLRESMLLDPKLR